MSCLGYIRTSPREIEDKANELNQKAGFKTPVDLYALAEANNLELSIQECELEDGVSGKIEIHKDNKVEISLNIAHHPNRQRFTLAHEIGHLILHRDLSEIFIDGSPYASVVFLRDELSSEGVYELEIEANNFAAALLMPEQEVKKEFNKLAMVFDSDEDLALRQLASTFKVSVQALMIRLAKLQLIPQELISLN